MENKKKLLNWGWLLLCAGSLLLTAVIVAVNKTDLFGYKELSSSIASVLAMLYGFTLIHTAKSVNR